MRPRTLSNVLTAVAAGSLVTASPTAHQHHKHPHQFEARAPDNVKTINVPGPTLVAYELNGQSISEDEVCKGIRQGILNWAEGTDAPPKCPAKDGPTSSAPASAPAVSTSMYTSSTLVVQHETNLQEAHHAKTTEAVPTPSATSSKQAQNFKASSEVATQPTIAAQDVPSTTSIEVSQATSPTKSNTIMPTNSAASSNLGLSSDSRKGQGLDEDFPDGLIDCSTFPSSYGPIKVDWAGLGGWSGIQYVTIAGNSITNIDTAVPGGSNCKPGAMCSYACPAGYQKSQWPTTQGATGQSVGGLRCDTNGKLRLTNPKLSKKLCIPGTGATVVTNKLSDNAAICRTDYPGTENEVVPLNTQPGTTSPLTCPDASTYFKHDGSSTTAQYYINNQGVPPQKACIWGSDGTNMGNWAPSFLGVGQDISGKTFLAIASTAQNNPSNYKPLNYTVEIVGHTTGKCRLKDGKYCSGPEYGNCNDKGCTVLNKSSLPATVFTNYFRSNSYQGKAPTFFQTDIAYGDH